MDDGQHLHQDFLAGNIKLDKEKSTEKIDGMVGTVMALNRVSTVGTITVRVYMMAGESCISV